MTITAGCVVEYSAKGTMPEIGAVLSFSPGTVRLMLTNGKETNIPEKKIILSTSRAAVPYSSKDLCKQSLNEINSKRNQIAETIDLSELREILSDSIRGYSLEELADFLFDKDDSDSAAALLRKLYEDKIYFKNKNNLFTPVTDEDMEQAILLQQKKEQAEKEEAMLAEAFKELASDKCSSFPEDLKEYLHILKEYIASPNDTVLPKKLTNVLKKADMQSTRKLFSALVRSGAVDEDENLDFIKYKINVTFSDDLKKEASALISAGNAHLFSGRKDLRDLKVWAIDSSGSKDRDDAFSFQQNEDGSASVWIHIADPSEIIKSDSPLDQEAMHRGSSIYMPDERIYMFPTELIRDLLSLDEGEDRMALTFKLNFDKDQNLLEPEIFESVIRTDKATDYETANELLNSDPWLKSAYEFSEKLKASRGRAGALLIPRQPELEITVENKIINVEFRDRETKTPGMVSEFMIWTNHAAAQWLRNKEIPAVYRIQGKNDESGETAEFKDGFEPVKFWQVLKTLKKTVVSKNSGIHSSLGVDGYTQVTSPLRRYSDLLLHRQIKAALHGNEPAYTGDELSQKLIFSDLASSSADSVMHNRDKYFLLKYLKQKRQELADERKELTFNGVVVENGSMIDVTFYCEFFNSFKRCRKPDFDTYIGQKVLVKPTQIDPSEGVIRFDIRPLNEN